ncbi:perlucin-like [Haliotis asinina]|uniref:perlucin-like n=1 Tax=Haliotis asinina TaxID=109174 RepID=UPI003531EF82
MLFILILISLAVNSSPCIETAHGTHWMAFTDIIIRRSSISEVPNIGNKYTCLGLCLQIEACVSVFYRQQQQRCQFHDVLFTSPQDGEQEIGTEYYSITTGGCPLSYVHNRILNMCYQIHLIRATFHAGEEDCNSRGEHLLVIDNAEKQSHMVNQINSSSDNMLRKFHIDGADVETEGHWVFHDGRIMTYFAWGPGYPQNGTDKNYLVADPQYGFLWSDKEGMEAKHYICERDL